MQVAILLKHLYVRIISLIGEVWDHKLSLAPTLISRQESARSCICVSGGDCVSLYDLELPRQWFILFYFILLKTPEMYMKHSKNVQS